MAERNYELAKDIIDATQGASFNLADETDNTFEILARATGPKAIQVVGGVSTSTDNTQGESVTIKFTHLPTYADVATAEGDSTLEQFTLYATSAGTLHIKAT